MDKNQKKVWEANMESARRQVQEQELSARSWKAHWEKMHYTLESEKLQPEYDAYLNRKAEEEAEARKKMEAYVKEMQEAQAKIEATANETTEETQADTPVESVPINVTENG